MRDHPRSRGVYRNPKMYFYFITGSSPLARGLPDRQCGAISIVRIIPARAGFTQVRISMLTSLGDHPRSRGVYMTT